MMVCFDDCPPNEFNRLDMEKAVARTIAWAQRCKIEYNKQLKKRKISNSKRPLIFGVIQGGAEIDLREHCTKELVKIGFDGYGFGARPVDKDGNFLDEVLRKTAEFIPADKIRFALGIGTPEDIMRCLKMGWDIFDCVIPTREGRHGRIFSDLNLKKYTNKTFNINNSKFANDFSALNKTSKIKELRESSKAFLHHLFKLNEPSGQRLASLNNLEFYNNIFTLYKKLK